MLETKLKPLAILCLVLGLALTVSAANRNWTGTNADANGLGYWDDPGNWDTYPTASDQAFLLTADSTVVVDDYDPNIAKECLRLILARSGAHDNITLWLKSFDGSGPGGVFSTDVVKMGQAGSQNTQLIVDAGEFNCTNLRVQQQDGAVGGSCFITVNGGVLNAGKLGLTEKTIEAQSTFTVNGGLVDVAGDLWMGESPADVSINLNGGTLKVGGNFSTTDALALDIIDGTLVLNGDQSALITQLVSSGQLMIAGNSAQRGGLFISHDADAGTTTVTADPSLANPNNAYAPVPLNAAIDVAPETATLNWSAGDSTAVAGGHDVYFGTDASTVENDGTDNALGAYLGRFDIAEAAVPEELIFGQTYYWRADQIAEDATVYKGRVWSFTVSESVLVDDFEGYDNQEPNEIYVTWKDGYEIADNGMQVGYLDPNYAETTIVKQGSQSMPLFYDNKDGVVNAEAKRTFVNAQDWSKHGIKSLSVMFRGEPDNTFGTVYIKINDEKKTYPLLANHMQFAQWKPWIINLKDVVTDLTKVTSLAIGIDGTGSGTLYIDDIRLYGQEAELMPLPDAGVEPDNTALVAHYLFDGNAEDSSGNGHHGTVLGTANWADGVFDGALDFSQTTGVDCGDFDPTGGTGKFTLTLWCYWEGGLIQHLVTKSTGWGADTMMFQIEIKGSDDWISEQTRGRFNLAYQGAPQAAFDRVTPHEWLHLALTFDGEQATGYLNGIDSIGPKATGIGPNVATPVILGATQTGDRILQGLMDDVRIYNYALTPTEVIGTIGGVDLGFKPF